MLAKPGIQFTSNNQHTNCKLYKLMIKILKITTTNSKLVNSRQLKDWGGTQVACSSSGNQINGKELQKLYKQKLGSLDNICH